VFNHKRIGIGLLTSSRCFSADQNNKSLDKLRNFLQYWKKWQTDFGLKKLFLPQQLVQGAHRIKKADSDQKRNFIIPASFETHHNFKQISILELLQLLEPEKKSFWVCHWRNYCFFSCNNGHSSSFWQCDRRLKWNTESGC